MIEMDVIGAQGASSDINRIGDRAGAMQPAFSVIRELILRGFATNFASEGGQFGEAWPPLAERTVELKGSDAVLYETGALASALRGGTGRRTSVGRNRLSVGIDGKALYYGRFAQGGTEKGEPARPIVGIGAPDVEESISTMERYIMYGLG